MGKVLRLVQFDIRDAFSSTLQLEESALKVSQEKLVRAQQASSFFDSLLRDISELERQHYMKSESADPELHALVQSPLSSEEASTTSDDLYIPPSHIRPMHRAMTMAG